MMWLKISMVISYMAALFAVATSHMAIPDMVLVSAFVTVLYAAIWGILGIASKSRGKRHKIDLDNAIDY